MSRTYRKYPDWVDWRDGAEDKLRRGHVSWPLAQTGSDGRQGLDEVWGQNGKKFAKRLKSRANRRNSKREIDSEFEQF